MRLGPSRRRILSVAVALVAAALVLAFEAHHYRLYRHYRRAEHSLSEMEPVQRDMAEHRRRRGDSAGAESFERLAEQTRRSAERYASLMRHHQRWLWPWLGRESSTTGLGRQ